MLSKKPKKTKAPKGSLSSTAIEGKTVGYSRRKLFVIVAANLLVVILAGLGVWYYLAHRSPGEVQLDPSSPYTKNIRRLENKPLPKKPLDQAIYYSQIAQNYETLEQLDLAITYYKKAQEVVEKNNLYDQLSFYQALGDVYVSKGDKRAAKLYYNKEIERLQDYKKQHPDDAQGAEDVIKQTQEAINKL